MTNALVLTDLANFRVVASLDPEETDRQQKEVLVQEAALQRTTTRLFPMASATVDFASPLLWSKTDIYKENQRNN